MYFFLECLSNLIRLSSKAELASIFLFLMPEESQVYLLRLTVVCESNPSLGSRAVSQRTPLSKLLLSITAVDS